MTDTAAISRQGPLANRGDTLPVTALTALRFVHPPVDIPPLYPTDPVDLHLHTYASDGAWSPADLIDYLAHGGFKVAAVCDHDTQRSVREATELGKERGIYIVPGVEMTCRWNNRQWHVLVYGIAPDRTDSASEAFRACLTEIDQELQRLAEDARQRLEAHGMPLPSVHEFHGDRPMWPFHVLSSAIKEQYVRNLSEAANLVVKLGGNFTADLPLERVVAAAHEAGGICVMAHPGRADAVGIMTEADLDRMFPIAPLDGLEAHYRSYSDQQTQFYREMAQNRSLLISCGSDSHAPRQPVDPRPWRAAWCADLLRALGVPVLPAPTGMPVWAPGQDPFAVKPKTVTDQAADAAKAAADAARAAAEAAKSAAEAATAAAEAATAAAKRVKELAERAVHI